MRRQAGYPDDDVGGAMCQTACGAPFFALFIRNPPCLLLRVVRVIRLCTLRLRMEMACTTEAIRF